MKEKIAIVGSGISGITCAYFLKEAYDVQVFEAGSYYGGHSNTVDIQVAGQTVSVDTGFIVFNHRTYPNLVPFFEHLQVPTYKSDMSFGVSIDTSDSQKMEYCGSSISQFFAQRKNIFSPKFWRMGFDVLKFNRESLAVDIESLDDITLDEFIDDLGLSRQFKDWYLYPMAGAIWSTPVEKVGDYPLKTFLTFFKNHGLLTVTDQPQWYTVNGGSREYVTRALDSKAITKSLNTPVTSVERLEDHVLVNGQRFDHVILACHAPDALKMIQDATESETKTLSKLTYSQNVAYLHSDPDLMPKNKQAWASWNYFNTSHEGAGVTYWMNLLQNLGTDQNIFVTLNPEHKPNPDLTYRTFHYEHPLFDQGAIEAQSQIPQLQGQQRTWFCGAYQRYGFHEDGIWSALRVINALGVKAPWQ